MLEEEKKEVELEATEEAPAEENQEEQKADKAGDPKTALLAFIFACVSFVFWYVPVLGLVAAILSFVFFKKLGGVMPEQKPHNIFAKITKIASIILLIVGVVVTAGFVIWAIIAIIIAIITAISAAASSLALL